MQYSIIPCIISAKPLHNHGLVPVHFNNIYCIDQLNYAVILENITSIDQIENQGEIWYKMIQYCPMTDFDEKLGQLQIQLSLKLNGIETNQIYFVERWVNGVGLSHNMRYNGIRKCQKGGSIMGKYPSIMGVSLPPEAGVSVSANFQKRFNSVNMIMFRARIFLWGEANSSNYMYTSFHADKKTSYIIKN